MSCRSVHRYCHLSQSSQTPHRLSENCSSGIHSSRKSRLLRIEAASAVPEAGQRTSYHQAASPVSKGKKHRYMSCRSAFRYCSFCKKISITHRSQNLLCSLDSPGLSCNRLPQQSVITATRNRKLASTHGSILVQVRTAQNRRLEAVRKQNNVDSNARSAVLTQESETGNAQQKERDCAKSCYTSDICWVIATLRRHFSKGTKWI